jgi:hypothetical protein
VRRSPGHPRLQPERGGADHRDGADPLPRYLEREQPDRRDCVLRGG